MVRDPYSVERRVEYRYAVPEHRSKEKHQSWYLVEITSNNHHWISTTSI
jgi:hypothetical protein